MTSSCEVRIETSTHCNFLCRFCPHSTKFKRKQEIMSNSLFEQLLNKVKKEAPLIRSLTLSGLGEATLDKGLIDKIEYAKNMNYDIHVLTNGSMLSKGKIRDLIDFGIKSLRFSVHAVDNNSYAYITGQSHIRHKVFEYIQYAFIFSRNTDTNIIVTSDIVSYNLNQVDKIIDRFDQITDLLEIWKVHNWADGFNFRNKKRTQKTCGRPFNGPLQIQVDGTINACGFDYNGILLLGDFKTQSLEEIFDSSMYRRLVDYHIGGEDEKLLCNGCDQLNRDTSVILYNSKFDPEDRVGRTSTNYQKLD